MMEKYLVLRGSAPGTRAVRIGILIAMGEHCPQEQNSSKKEGKKDP
jgi:hypothetical protein